MKSSCSFRCESGNRSHRLALFYAKVLIKTRPTVGQNPVPERRRRTKRACPLSIPQARLLTAPRSPHVSVQVFGCNHIAIEVDDVGKAIQFYQDVFNLEKLDSGEGDAFFKLGEHQFLAIFEVKTLQPDRTRHFGIMVRDEAQLSEVRDKVVRKYGLPLNEGFRCDFRDPFGNRIQVGDLHDESLIWLLPYREVQKAGVRFADSP